jgi:hypothetical protein
LAVSGIDTAWRFRRLWHGLVLAGAFRHAQDFGERGLMNGYVVATVTGLAGMGALYLLMEARSRRMAGESLGNSAG